LLFPEKIGFAEWTSEGPQEFEGQFRKWGKAPVYQKWNYSKNYTRDPGLASWLDAQVGTVKKGNADGGLPNGGLKNVTGYDLAEYIRKWQHTKHLNHLSVGEIILVEPDFKHLRQYASIANVFWSHIQMESFVGSSSTYHDQSTKNEMSTIYMMNDAHSDFKGRLPPQDSCFYWLDYFCLRQCRSDFDVDCTIELIKDIGKVVSAIDSNFEYIKRSFCILELYAAVQGNSNLMCLNSVTSSKYDMCQILAVDRAEATGRNQKFWVGPIKVEAAQTGREQDKNMIDGFLQQLPGGFTYVNKVVIDALFEPLI